MSITSRKYVDITSAVGGEQRVRQRELIARLFSSNPLTPAGAVLEFTTAEDVVAYYGAGSPEAVRAIFYFGFISKSATRAKKISFVLYSPSAMAARLYGGNASTASLTALAAISNGGLTVTLGAVTTDVAGIDLTGVVTFAAVATAIQTRIRAASAGPAYTGATVTFDVTSGRFIITSGTTGIGTINVTPTTAGGATDLAAPLFLTPALRTVASDGSIAETAVESFTASSVADDNFATFLFIPALTIDNEIAIAAYNKTQNFRFLFVRKSMTVADALTAYTALSSYGGTASTLSPLATEFPEMMPMVIAAATDFTRRAANKNYMFQQASGLTPAVRDTTVSNTLDAARTNYYGRTQTAGQAIDFYQRGTLMGVTGDASDMNVYINEVWLKDRAASVLLSMLLALEALPANVTGRGYVLSNVQSVVDEALNNGVISVGKTLNVTQKTYITEQTGDDLAWFQVQNIGYWLNADVQSYVTAGGAVEYRAVYLLVYSKGDVIRSIEGSHVLV